MDLTIMSWVLSGKHRRVAHIDHHLLSPDSSINFHPMHIRPTGSKPLIKWAHQDDRSLIDRLRFIRVAVAQRASGAHYTSDVKSSAQLHIQLYENPHKLVAGPLRSHPSSAA